MTFVADNTHDKGAATAPTVNRHSVAIYNGVSTLGGTSDEKSPKYDPQNSPHTHVSLCVCVE